METFVRIPSFYIFIDELDYTVVSCYALCFSL